MPLAVASNYPVLDIFWTIIEFFLWVIWIWILIMIFIDIFRSHDLSGWSKALWFLFVLFIPLIGVLCYLIVRGGSMHERSVRQARREADAFYASYGRHAAPEATDGGGGSTADQLAKLADLRDRGVLSQEEFDREKAKVLAA
ncbi:MAG TPA: SHOCT domain-containing protein [Streptosporangiaceae bacterium]|jgi:putative oligomerization/nucleic acid binding protein/phospholipase D-like protein